MSAQEAKPLAVIFLEKKMAKADLAVLLRGRLKNVTLVYSCMYGTANKVKSGLVVEIGLVGVSPILQNHHPLVA